MQIGGLSINNPLAVTPTTTAPKSQGYFWKGANGQVYVQGSQGIHPAGAWDNNTANYWSSRGFTRTPDSPQPQASSAPAPASHPAAGGSGGGGGAAYGSSNASGGTTIYSAPQYPDKTNDINMQNAGLGSVGSTETTGIKAVDDALAKIMGEYNADLGTAKTEYGNESTENTKDLQTNKQASLERGVQGRQGLFGTLASIGALNGTGIDLANRAVAKGTNEDLTTAADTYATNQNALDSGYNAYTQQEKRLQEQAQRAHDQDVEQVHNDAARSRQQYLTNLANDYQDEGKTEEAKNFAAQAAALFPAIASTNVPTINLGYSGGAYAAPTLSQYVGKANNTSVQTTPGSTAAGRNIFSIPGLVALNKKQSA